MQHPIRGLHHVTATVDDAQADLDFCRGLLGLRLVKKTVNFDNHNVFHFYYGDEQGNPGSIWTTFPYKGWGVPAGTKGAGQVTVTTFSVPAGSLGFWKARLRAQGVEVRDVPPRFGQEGIGVHDPSGLAFELLESVDARVPWTAGGVGGESAVRGLHSVTLLVHEPTKTIALMQELLGYRVATEEGGRTRLFVGTDQPGHLVDVVADPGAVDARNGLGTVHHMAMAIDTPDEQLRLRAELIQLGMKVTEVLDRQYFRSIYFREPGGVLFEVATIPPGFAVDETPVELGLGLRLPPWEEPNRAAIERGLPAIR
jgi:glyoxalase family protein